MEKPLDNKSIAPVLEQIACILQRQKQHEALLKKEREGKLQRSASCLLRDVYTIVQKAEDTAQKTGSRYNIFEIAGLSKKETLICRFIADLLNPQGAHGKGDIYLKAFWDIVSKKIQNCPILKPQNAIVSAEYYTDPGRRIDIVIEERQKKIFIPIEVKIRAGEQSDQIHDYYAFSKTKNGGNSVPVLFLTPDGRKAETAKSEDEYVCLSFRGEILAWLETCLKLNKTKDTHPVWEILRQLVGAVRSISGYTEDKEMNEAILESVFQSEEFAEAATAVKETLDEMDGESWNLFKGAVFKYVTETLPDADCYARQGWKYIEIPIRKKYTLSINYDLHAVQLVRQDGKKIDADLEKTLAERMAKFTNTENVDPDTIWESKTLWYKGFAKIGEQFIPYERYKLFRDHPEQAAREIVRLAQMLEQD